MKELIKEIPSMPGLSFFRDYKGDYYLLVEKEQFAIHLADAKSEIAATLKKTIKFKA